MDKKRIFKGIHLQGTRQENTLHYADCELACGTDEICECNEREAALEVSLSEKLAQLEYKVKQIERLLEAHIRSLHE